MRLRIVWIMSLIVGGTLNSTAQKFCQHMKQQNQLAMQNTLDPRSDTFDVISYEINAAFLNYESAKSIDAMCKIDLTHKIASSSVTLDLLGLTVDSVFVKGVKMGFSHMGSNLKIDYAQSESGALEIEVYYHGKPMSDPQWGGFYFTGEYAFNLGVGFASDPHNFGRVWFPCFDNFTDRSIYYTNVTVNEGYKAYANGYLTDAVDNGNQTITYKWTMDEPIPTYLASVAMAKYEEVKMTVDGIPVLLTALQKDTANLRSSFENLPECIRRFEGAYGDHTFDRIGFNIVPFNSGAMEHATNIAYPLYAIANGGKANETLFAHELAHHWWGNTITCRTQEDMWLNEGWASYSERLFLEAVYGKTRYDEDIEDNHRDVLQFAHVRDGDVLPVSGIGHANTYGSHVYNKGADMVHTLRGMMGDEDFFEACASFQKEFKFKDVSTDDMKSHFQLFTPLNLSGFFDQWVKEKGFAHFDILWALKTDDTYQVRIKQTPRFNEVTYRNVVATVTAFSKDFERFDSQIIIMNDEQNFDIACPFEPVSWFFDFDDKISDAVTTDMVIVQPGGVKVDMPQSLMSEIWVNNPTDDSVMLRIEHNWAPADGSFGKPAGAVLSKERYWNVGGVWGDDVNVTAEIIYSGLQSNSLVFGYLDKELIRITEDSLVLLYRPNASSAWTEATDYVKNSGSLFDKRGVLEVSNLKKGQYTLAMYDASLASNGKAAASNYEFKVFPNPAQDELTIELQGGVIGTTEITNAEGRVVYSMDWKGNERKQKLDISHLSAGTYFVGIVSENLAYDVKRFVVE